MGGLLSKPKAPKPQKVEAIKLPKPVAPPAPIIAADSTAVREEAILTGRKRRSSGLSGLILTPLGSGGSTGAQGGKPNLGN